MNSPIKIAVTWELVRNVCAGFVATIFFLFFLGQGAVWGLEKHFDDRYVIVADSLKGELRKLKRELHHLKTKGGDPSDIELLEQQIEEIKEDIADA